MGPARVAAGPDDEVIRAIGNHVAAGGSPLHTAFVLSSGASLGALQVGMLRALYEHGITPDLLIGTSAGALNAAFVASRPQTPATVEELGRIWRNLQREDIFPISMSALAGGVWGRRDHLVPDRGLRQLIRRYIEFRRPRRRGNPTASRCMRSEGCELLLSDGPAIDAVVAAASIPGVFPPVEMAERRLIDGGVVNNTPISHAAELGAVRIYVLPTQDPCRPLGRVPKGALDAAIYGLELLIDSRLKTDIAQYSRETEIIVLPAQTPPVCNRRASSTLPVSSAKRSSPRGPFLNPRASAGTSGSQHRGTRRRMVGE